ncbi:MAG: FAD-dependent oxidoreductase, partial [Verrucomicrobia bacterium]|nr:FAD-dependent oxidoreductase [Verrucomicrobiota bacterium]MBU1857687.1 FAD-dependent oxidoreductase [Verrucomicrobiota bacterium]
MRRLKVGETFTREIKTKIIDEADVVVAGGGTAGVVAALAAARNGAKTLLIERYGFLGGMMTAGNAGLT